MPEAAPRLSHVGLYVRDVPKMIDFYTKVLGFVVSDGAEDGRITFLSRNPSDHHQVVLVRGRTTDLDTAMVQQVSFNVETLGNVQKAFRKVRDTAMPGRSISRTPKATRSRCSATRRGTCRSLWASRSTSKCPRTSFTARPKPTAGPATGSNRSRNGAPIFLRRLPQAWRRKTDPYRHSRESGNPGLPPSRQPLDPRFRGGDGSLWRRLSG
jgi:hypothetical protein